MSRFATMSTAEIRNEIRNMHELNEALLARARAENRERLTDDETRLFDAREAEIREVEQHLPREEPIRPEIPGMERAGVGELRSYGAEDRMTGAWGASPPLPDGIRADELSLGRCLRGIVTGDWRGAEAEHRALQSVGVGVEGGFTVPTLLAEGVLDRARADARVMQAGARTLPMDAPTLVVSRLDTDPVAYWRAEHAPITESAAEFSTAMLRAQVLAVLVRGSVEWLEDSADGPEMLERAMRSAISLELDRAALFGSGAGEPAGLNIIDGVQSEALDGAIAGYGPFSRAFYLVRQANYVPSAWIHSVRTERDVDLLTDTTDQPLRPPRSWEAVPRGHLSTTMIPTNLGDGEDESLSFVGQWDMLTLGLRRDIVVEMARFGDTDSAKKMQVLFRAYVRADTLPMRPEAFARVTGIK